MIKRLQKQFILVAVSAVTVVMLLVLGVIVSTAYHRVGREADHLLAFIADNDGEFPRGRRTQQNSDVPPEKPASDAAPGADVVPKRLMSAEAPFETRYFFVRLDGAGNVVKTHMGNIAAVSEEQAIAYAKRIGASSKVSGYEGVYRYLARKTEDGALVMFVDCSRDMESFALFRNTSLIVFAVSLAGIFLLVVLFSKTAVRPVAESYNKQKQFITDASHELKTPLTVISANTELLEMENGENEWTRSIQHQVARLTELTNSLVTLSRMQEEDKPLVMTDFSLSDAVEESVAPYVNTATQQGKTLQAAIAKNLSYNGDETSIRKLVGILLDNAVKYTPTGGDIDVTLKREGRNNLLCVHNTAEAMKTGNHNEMFERFYRGDASRNSQTGGYGIGLSIARSIVAAHKGRITARSEDGRSLTITVLL
ncbi:MAG: HAMP domain-containing sensor histidine kinase [Clostridia bacterium]|nr:HAMP domain-containing sensor histidine kinase [Clostridia bacterium]